MGLDIVELVMRVEETFSIDIPDDEAGRAIAVGALYRLVLEKLNLPYQPSAEIEAGQPVYLSRYSPWTTASVWTTLKKTIADQLQLDPEEISESAHWGRDLGAD